MSEKLDDSHTGSNGSSDEEIIDETNESIDENVGKDVDISPDKDGKLIKQIIKEGKGNNQW